MTKGAGTAAFVAAGAVLLLMLSPEVAGAQQAACPAQEPPQVRNDRGALEAAPTELGPRLRLAESLTQTGCYDAAVHVLEQGEALHGQNADWQAAIRKARSFVSEEAYIEGLERAEQSAKIQRNVLRCSRLADLAACEEAAKAKPDDWQVRAAQGDAFMQANRPADAERAYRRAAELRPGDAALTGKIGAAQSLRARLVRECESGSGNPALQACDAALVRGAPDEFSLLKRKGILLQAAGQPAQALDAYIAAIGLRESDHSVALAVVALTESTGRQDAVALMARGTALMALRRPAEAVAALKQAQALTPGLPEVGRKLGMAESAARSAPPESARVAAAPPPVAAAPSAPAPVRRKYSNESPVTRSH